LFKLFKLKNTYASFTGQKLVFASISINKNPIAEFLGGKRSISPKKERQKKV